MRLDQAARAAGFATRTNAQGGIFQVVNRIVMEELEAWFFGDQDALTAAYPRIRRRSLSKARYRDPDSIPGGTWEALAAILKRAGYYSSRMPKIEVARAVSLHMTPERNRSPSFRVFRSALREMVMPSEDES